MLDSEDPIKIESWIHHVFSEASGPLKAFAFLTMIKPDKTERFGASELDKLVGLLRLNFYQYFSEAVITHGSNIVTSSGSLQDTFLYLLVSHSAPIVRAQDKGARIFGPPALPWFVLARGRVVRGPWGLVPVVATASFPLINLPNFYLSFTILVSFILVKYPDRIGLVNTVPTVRYLRYGTPHTAAQASVA